MYQYIGDLTHYREITGGIEAAAGPEHTLRVEYLEDTGFRVRYASPGPFSKLFSNATLENPPQPKSIRVRDHDNFIVLQAGDAEAIIHKTPLRLTFRDPSGFEFHKDSFGAAFREGKVAHFTHKPPQAVYYGLGEKAGGLNRTNRAFTNWNTDMPGYGKHEDPLYKTFPFYIGLQGGTAWGVFYDNPFKTDFDFGARLKDHAGYYADGGELRYYVFYGPGIKRVLQCYTGLTGRTPLPPLWSLGYHQSRWSYYPEHEVRLLAEEFRQRSIPCDALHLDIDYMDGYRVFTWDERHFPHPRKMLSDLKDKGFKVVVLVDPGVKTDPDYPVYREGLQSGFFATLPDGSPYRGEVWPGETCFPDFSHPGARIWWGNRHRMLIDQGVRGIWTDMNEPAVFGGKTMPDIVLFHNEGRGGGHAEMHNQYGLLMAKATYEGLVDIRSDERPFVLTRAAYAGVQRYSSVWTGDNSATWDDVGLAPPMLMGLGLAGVPFAGYDIGGFTGTPDGEMYLRSLQIGAFAPFMRTHTAFDTGRQEPWSYGKEYEHINREIIRFRYRLLPYLYTAFYQHTQTGSPVMRPLVWEFQDDEQVYDMDDQFLFGDHLMVAPVVKKGSEQRTVYLPRGNWYNFFTGERVQGGQTITVKAPLITVDIFNKVYDQPLRGIPVFVRAGAAIAMGEVQQYTGEKETTALDLKLFDGSSRSLLYEDDGHSFHYEKGAFRLTTIETRSAGRYLEIETRQTGAFEKAAGLFRAAITGLTHPPATVTLNGEACPFLYEPAGKTLRLDFFAGAHLLRIDKGTA